MSDSFVAPPDSYCIEPAVRQGAWTARLFSCLLLLLCTAFALGTQADPTSTPGEAKAPIHLGLLPHLSSELLIRKYQPLIDYFEQSLQRPVVVSTAPDFATYMERATQGRYDVYLTAPHIAAYHEVHDRHRRLARFSRELRGVIVVTENSSYRGLMDLQGKNIAAPDSLAVITLLGEVTLQNSGMNLDNDVAIKYTPSHNNAIRSVTQGRADAAIAGLPALKMVQTSANLGVPVRILSKTEAIPHMMFMSPARVSEVEAEQYSQALLGFTADGAGEVFFSSTPFGDMTGISDQDMARLAAMLSLLERRLEK